MYRLDATGSRRHGRSANIDASRSVSDARVPFTRKNILGRRKGRMRAKRFDVQYIFPRRRPKQEKNGSRLGVTCARCAKTFSRELLGTASTTKLTELMMSVHASKQHRSSTGRSRNPSSSTKSFHLRRRRPLFLSSTRSSDHSSGPKIEDGFVLRAEKVEDDFVLRAEKVEDGLHLRRSSLPLRRSLRRSLPFSLFRAKIGTKIAIGPMVYVPIRR